MDSLLIQLSLTGSLPVILGSDATNPIPTRGADYVHRIIACPPEFENLTASLLGMYHVAPV